MAGTLAEVFRRYGYDPDDPVRGREVPDRLLRMLASVDAPSGRNLNRLPLRSRVPSGAELDCLELVACGLVQKEIAARLGRSIWVVQEQLKAVYAKLDARGAANAVAIAVARGLIPRET